jgi:hypothetical protein
MQLATQSFFSRSHDAVIRVFDEAGNVIETYEHKGRFQRTVAFTEFFYTLFAFGWRSPWFLFFGMFLNDPDFYKPSSR